MYNLIFNKFFRQVEDAEVDLDSAVVQTARYRPSTFMERLLDDANVSSTQVPIDVENAQLDIDQLRKGFSDDRWTKTRNYYGSKYVDYLNALGVESGWSITDDPELIGMRNMNMRLNTVEATSNSNAPGGTFDNNAEAVGDPGGLYKSSNTLSLRKTFCPEHGLIMILATTRIDIADVTSGRHGSRKINREDFWSPEFNTERVTRDTFGFGNLAKAYATWDDYRFGQNQTIAAAGDLQHFVTKTVTSSDGWRIGTADQLSGFFNGNTTDQFSLQAIQRLSRVSPIPPAQAISGVQ